MNKNFRIPFALLAFAVLAAQAQPDRSTLRSVPVDELKSMYLSCDRQALSHPLDLGTAANCSMVSDELLARGFDGNFNELLSWYRVAHVRNACADPDAAPAPEQCDNDRS